MKKIIYIGLLLHQTVLQCSDIDQDHLQEQNSSLVSQAESITQEFIDALSQNDLEELFIFVAPSGDANLMRLIINSPKFQNFDPSTIQKGLLIAADIGNFAGHNDIVQMIIDSGRIHDIKLNSDRTGYEHLSYLRDSDFLGEKFKSAAEFGYVDLVELFMNSSSYNDISAYYLGQALIRAIENGHEKIAAMIISDRTGFNEIDSDPLILALKAAAQKGSEKIVQMILKSKRLKEISSKNLEFCLKKALENNCIGCANWIRAYSALKLEKKLDDLSQLDNQMYDAYQEFLNGNSNDLRNLIFPVGKKETSHIYAISPRANSETQAFKMIDSSLLKLFKREHIKPLLFALVDKEFQKDIALEHIQQMGLTKKDIAATKIQSAFRDYSNRKKDNFNKK